MKRKESVKGLYKQHRYYIYVYVRVLYIYGQSHITVTTRSCGLDPGSLPLGSEKSTFEEHLNYLGTKELIHFGVNLAPK